MINVKIENASRESHHTVRLTPANGERVDPTTLKGAAIWDDELSLCLAPITRDLSCLGTDEVAIFTTVPETFGDWEFKINDVDMGYVSERINDSESPLKIEMTEVEGGFLTRLENRTGECIRIDFNYNGDVQPDMFVLAEASQGVHHEILEVPGSEGWMYYQIHLGPTRLNSVSLDFSFNSETQTNISQTFAGAVDFRINTSNLLPTEGLTFTVEGETYTFKKGEKELIIPITIPANPTKYPVQWRPTFEISHPEYLLGGEMPELDEITILPTGFNYAVEMKFATPNTSRVITSDRYYPTASFYDSRPSEGSLRTFPNQEVTLELDSSFAGSEVRLSSNVTLNPLVGVLDAAGKLTFNIPGYIFGRKEVDLGIKLHEPDNPTPYFSIYSVTGWCSRFIMWSDTFGAYSEVAVSMSRGYGTELRISHIPAEIDEIEVYAMAYNHAPDDVTPFHTPKRAKRDPASGNFLFKPDQPVRTYSSSAGSMVYHVNYFAARLYKDGKPTDWVLTIDLKLNVTGG